MVIMEKKTKNSNKKRNNGNNGKNAKNSNKKRNNGNNGKKEKKQ